MNKHIKAARTFNITIWNTQDGAVISTTYMTVSIIRFMDGSVQCDRDGVSISEEEAIGYAQEASYSGRMVLISEYAATEEIGVKAGHQLHIELGRLGFKNHFEFATQILGRVVDHFRTLTKDEAREVRSAAFGQFGMVG
ncbi:hypothetical protein [Deinococcus ruber]|uniref:Uncharacterized protein n=1 Tax=Deinococcus ruber TaxID=1848197 RepID=A0A918FIN9_9DEIO|nr:hypothetical protein [Deinococcus ruber]GGR39800.1 hypothetical protein GCM10008957_55680 [Deinococcus ruber]